MSILGSFNSLSARGVGWGVSDIPYGGSVILPVGGAPLISGDSNVIWLLNVGASISKLLLRDKNWQVTTVATVVADAGSQISRQSTASTTNDGSFLILAKEDYTKLTPGRALLYRRTGNAVAITSTANSPSLDDKSFRTVSMTGDGTYVVASAAGTSNISPPFGAGVYKMPISGAGILGTPVFQTYNASTDKNNGGVVGDNGNGASGIFVTTSTGFAQRVLTTTGISAAPLVQQAWPQYSRYAISQNAEWMVSADTTDAVFFDTATSTTTVVPLSQAMPVYTNIEVRISQDGTTAVIAAPSSTAVGQTSAGMIHVFQRTGTTWTQTQTITAPTPVTNMMFGMYMDFSRNAEVLCVSYNPAGTGAPNVLQIFTLQAGLYV